MTPEQQRIGDESDSGGLIYPIPPPVANPVDTSIEAAIRRNRRQCEQWNREIEAKKEQARVEEERRSASVAAAEHRAFRESVFRRTAHRVGQKDAEARKQKFITEMLRRQEERRARM